MSYKVPHHMVLQQQDSDNKVEQGPSPSTTATSTNLFNNMKKAPQYVSYSKSSYDTTHETLSLVLEESDVLPHPTAFISGGIMDEEVDHGISPSTTATYDDLSDLCHHIES